uniref:Uncharacterized protein n=1 Tax=Arundo donax TaxID=35708 RepID=A0A0A8ZP60_ARUDO
MVEENVAKEMSEQAEADEMALCQLPICQDGRCCLQRMRLTQSCSGSVSSASSSLQFGT